MGILVKKRQQGGGLYADPRYLKLNSDRPGGRVAGGQQTPYGGGNIKQPSLDKSKVETEGDKLEGLLRSDIIFLQNENTAIERALAEGHAKDPNFDDTPDRQALLARKYQLESVLRPQMKAMAKEYDKSKTKFQNADAGDAPAIVGNKAIVESADGYKLVSTDELITNAKNYKLLSAQDILSRRFDNEAFSGFTELGQVANQLIDEAYGSKSYDKDFDANLEGIGYTKGKGSYIKNTDGKVLDFGGIEFDEKSKLITKTNAGALTEIYASILGGDSHINSYLKNKAISFLYKGVQNGEIDLEGKDLNELKAKSAQTQLLSKLKARLISDESAKGKSGSGAGEEGTKDRKGTVMSNAAANLYMSTSRVEIDNIKDISNPSVGSLMHNMPTAYISKGGQLLEQGYGKNIKIDGEEGASETNLKSLGNNYLINDIMGGQSDVTIFNGTPLSDLADGKLQRVKISSNPNMKITLAPCVKDDKGKWVVDYTNEFTPKMLEAIQATYDELGKTLTQIDAAKMDEKDIQKFEEIAKKHMMRLLPNISDPPVIKAAIALNVMYESVNSDVADDPNSGWNVDKALVNDIAPSSMWRSPTSHYAKETVAFIPISDSFWRDMKAQGTFSSEFETTIPAADYEGIWKSKNEQSGDFIRTMAMHESQKKLEQGKKGAVKHQKGGKLFTDEELTNLLFN